MAKRIHLSKFSIGSTLNKPQKSLLLPSCKPFCSLTEKQEPTSTNNSTTNLQGQVQEQARHEHIQKLQTLLQQGRTETARRLIRSMLLPKSPFSSPSHLYTLFSLSSTPMKPLFSDMLLSICSESKMVSESAELYMLMKNDGVFPSVASLNLFLESLVSTKRYEETLQLFSETVESGLRPDQFMYGKAIQAAVKLGDLKRATELMTCMKRGGVSPGVFVYNVVIGGLCKEKRVKDAEKLFDEMLDRRVAPNRITYNTLIDGIAKWNSWRRHLIFGSG
ncbi:Pentatricopeptide repeat-containing protein, mitochondrial [Vitis vinifera]|uniref:Pentatricopeptide repeat-containing protein, mitochondrial n=1 Tax=Vitis vinifera TaxID=29760 RepID=A0A438EKF5_VITVI|nr:Pentatricopeptide repeat-containing protein, mitochondrial [Vitis vinifera]